MPTICILKIYNDRGYDSNGDNYSDCLKLLQCSDWIDVNDDDLYEIKRGLQYLPVKDDERWSLFIKPEENQSKLVEMSIKCLKKVIKEEKELWEKKEQDRLKKIEDQRIAKENKKKHKELLKKISPEQLEKLLESQNV